MSDILLNPWQWAYCLARMSDALAGMSGTVDWMEQKLNGKLLDFFDDQKKNHEDGGKWDLVWGPVVFQASLKQHSESADNVMFVAKDVVNATYMVCIAGTNTSSKYDLGAEDLAFTAVKWGPDTFPSLPGIQAPSGLNPYLTEGTQLGVNNLLAMRDRNGPTLESFIGMMQGMSSNLIFCGHSLGGVLAPTLALALFTGSKFIKRTGYKNVYLYPIAGPTPGNGDLAKYIAQVFPPVDPQGSGKPYTCWSKNVWNSLDMVPHAWNVDMLSQVPSLYTPKGDDTPPTITKAIDAILPPLAKQAQSEIGPYKHIPNQKLMGTLNKAYYPATTDDFFNKQVAWQHTIEYDNLLEIPTSVSRWWTSNTAPIIEPRTDGSV